MVELRADFAYMAQALRLARRGLYTTDPNPRVGCVVVKDNTVVGSGWHERAGGPHAEIHALAAAAERSRGATVYVTLEPCVHHGRTPPCTDALIAAGVARVVVAMVDPNPRVGGQGLAALAAAGIAVESGVLHERAEALNPGFASRMRRGRPYVRLKLAASLDGRTAMASGESAWITSESARIDGQRWRARSSAVMCGIGTVRADDPALTVRAFATGRQPLRVVLDSHLTLSPRARVLSPDAPTLVVSAEAGGERAENLQRTGAEVIALPGADGEVDLRALMRHLAACEVNELLVESGPTLAGTLLRERLVDELVLYLAPTLLGDTARAMFELPGLVHLQDRIRLAVKDLRPVGRDWRVICEVGGPRNED